MAIRDGGKCEACGRCASSPDEITKQLHKAKSETSDRERGRISTGPINLTVFLGHWANKAVQIGLVSQEITEETSRTNPRLDPTEAKDEREIEWSVTFIPETRLLVQLIARAAKSMAGERTAHGKERVKGDAP